MAQSIEIDSLKCEFDNKIGQMEQKIDKIYANRTLIIDMS